MAKRRLLTQLPPYNQTEDLECFFGSTMDQVFQPGTSENLTGYIGHRLSADSPDFYIAEPTASRAAYQLEAGMVSIDTNDNLISVLPYADFISYIKTNGGLINDHQRLTETEYYSWSPPINIDMCLNFHYYYWFGDSTGALDLPILELTIPVLLTTGDGHKRMFTLPSSIESVPTAQEKPAVYVNNIPLAAAQFTITGDMVLLAKAPTDGTSILITRVPDYIAAIKGQTNITVTDINTNNVTTLSSGMRIKVIDAKYLVSGWDVQPFDYAGWDYGGSGAYLVDGIGQSARFTDDDTLIRGVAAPQYITIDRSSADSNLWSLHNLWVHRDSFAWAKDHKFYIPLIKRQAITAIVEYPRDIELWHHEEQVTTTIARGTNAIALTRVPPNLIGTFAISSHLLPNTFVEGIIGTNLILSKPILTDIPVGSTIVFRQTWEESTDPRFMLYDLDNVALNDPIRYPDSDFVGSPIFTFAQGTGPRNETLRRSLKYDQNGYVVYDNKTVTQRFQSNGSEITGFYAYAIGVGTKVIESLWHPSQATTSQGITNGFADIPLNLQANPSADDVQTLSRSQWTEHFTSLINNQSDLIGIPLGPNNYRDTSRDITTGTAIVQHRAALLKAMLLASNPSFDLVQAIRFTNREYIRFRNKFARKLYDMYINGVLNETNPADVWVTTALADLKRDKTTHFPFALNTIAGNQYFIPPTPTCLGMMPSAVPAMVTDTSYTPPMLLILGHDGSLTPAHQDWRDPLILAFEQMVYDHLPIKLNEARPMFDIQQWIGGRFYQPYNGYTRDEVSTMLTPLFEIWVQQNRLDFRTNDGFDSNDPFTWNFHGMLDRAGNPLPGNWRAIYRWYFGTDVPNLRPWEMLGFVSEPSWWSKAYGDPPYTRSNYSLWADLEDGVIRQGPRMGTDDTYARPDLSAILPIDDHGRLLDPVTAGIVDTVSFTNATRPWMAGDHGPVENVWINSPSYRFALATISFLMKPARFVEECWDLMRIGYRGQQWLDLFHLARPLNSNLVVHGETKDEAPITVIGISQWITDFLRSSGQDSAAFGTAIRGLDVRLMHQMAGFTSTDDIKIVADNFGLVPAEDVDVVLYRSPNTSSEVYSGVILEWTGQAWRAIGYDARDAYFTVIPPDVNGPKGLISLATAAEPSIIKWRSNTYYPLNILVEWYNTVWQCQRSHTSGPQFEQSFWQSRPDLNTSMIRAPRVITYLRGSNTTQRIPYGTEFTTYQDVADFLLGWQRWLEARGWVFDDLDSDSGEVRNWSLAVKEFLNWAQVQWAPGNFIALSPGQQLLKFDTETGMVLNVESDTTGFFGLLDRSGRPIRQHNAMLCRLDGELTIHAMNADVFGARLDLANMEHILVFSNTTIFDDTIYQPLCNVRQSRLRLMCTRAQDWSGRLDAPGFMLIGGALRSDFEKAPNDIRLMFDIETTDRAVLRAYARHVIGFQKRDYLENLLLSDTEQFEFYAGMIQQKGAPGVFRKLTRSDRASNNSNLQFLEEWAIRLDEFGAMIDPFFTFQLRQTETRDDPQIVRFVPTSNAPLDWITFASVDARWVDRPANPSNFFPMHSALPALPSAGPVRLSEVTYTAVHSHDVPGLYLANGFPTGSSIWVYETADGTYTVLRCFETGTAPNAIQQVIAQPDGLFNVTRLVFQRPITLSASDIGNFLIIDGPTQSHPEVQGIATIVAVYPSSNIVDIDSTIVSGHDFTVTPTSAPFVRVFRPVRFATRANIVNYRYAIGDLIWIDNDGGGWTVLQWTGFTWSLVRQQPLRCNSKLISETVIYRLGTRIIDQQMFVDEPVVSDVIVIDPLAGLIAGMADREIDYKLSYDPARYNAGNELSVNPWGVNEVGRVWWNLDTVKFLDPYTDRLGISNQRDLAELSYRLSTWAHIAPGTKVEVYEWVESIVDPIRYQGPGTVYNSATPSWVEVPFFDHRFGAVKTKYYFWVQGLTETPSLPSRHTDVSTIALAIQNPSGLNLAWMAPITPDALIVSGVAAYLNDTSTVMKVRLSLDANDPGRHDQWTLLRPADETSLPPWQVWQKLRDSLAGFDGMRQPIPSPVLSPNRATGIRALQGMFTVDSPGSRRFLLDARRSFVTIINKIFSRIPMRRDRLNQIAALYRSDTRVKDNDPITAYLIWTQVDQSYAIEPPPHNEWDMQVYSYDERNRLLAHPMFFTAAQNGGPNLRILVNGLAQPFKHWSIWEFDALTASTFLSKELPYGIGNYGNGIYQPDPRMVLVDNADKLLNLASAYEYAVASEIERNNLTLRDGDRVLVINDAEDFWTIWKYLPNDPLSATFGPYGFVLWRIQRYRTADFVEIIDWYADGYSAKIPPSTNYETISRRNAMEGDYPISQFVQINDDGSSGGDVRKKRWVWLKYDPDAKQWTTVALQQGTIALSSNLYDPTRVQHDVMVWSVTSEAASPDDITLTLTDTTGIAVGQFVVGPGINHRAKIVTVSQKTITLDMAVTESIASGTLIGVTDLNVTDIAKRDGSWELYVLTDILRYSALLTDSEISEIFFSMLNFVHVQQDGVDWAFKTSFMSIIGYDVPLQQTPVLLSDQTNSLLDYINEVKPYHVKIRELGTQYKPDMDIATLQVLDQQYVDMTMLFDRYGNADAWDINPYDSFPWDGADDGLSHIYTQTTLLAIDGNIVHIDDVRFLQALTAVSPSNPLTIMMGGEAYRVSFIAVDSVNVSQRPYGTSGQLTVIGSIQPTTIGSIVEAIITVPSASARIAMFNAAFADLSSDEKADYLGIAMPQSMGQYKLKVDAIAGDTSLLLDHIDHIVVGQPVSGPHIPRGTVISGITGNVIYLNRPIIGATSAGAPLTIGLPNVISGGDLFLPNAPNTAYVSPDLSGKPVVDTSINPSLTSRPGGYDLRPPYYAANHQQESLPFNGDDALHYSLIALPAPGCPPQAVHLGTPDSSTLVVYLDVIPQSDDGIMVFINRIRVSGSQYVVDHIANTVTVTVPSNPPGPKEVLVHIFGHGGTAYDTLILSFASNPITFVNLTRESTVVVVDSMPTDQYSLANNQISLTTPPPIGTEVAIVYRNPLHTTLINVKTYNYSDGQPTVNNDALSWLLSPRDTDTVPEHAGTIVEVNGQRLMPPLTYYNAFTLAYPWIPLPFNPTGVTMDVYVDGVLYTSPIPVCSVMSIASTYLYHLVVPGNLPNVRGKLVIYQHFLIALEPEFEADITLVIKDAPSLPTPDYTVVGGHLTILKTMVKPTDQIVVTTFSNAVSMGAKTTVYPLGATTWDVVSYGTFDWTSALIAAPVPTPILPNYALVSMNGLALVQGIDYDFETSTWLGPVSSAYGLDEYGVGPYGIDVLPHREQTILRLHTAQTLGDLTITVFTKPIAHDLMQSMSNSVVPADVRMLPATDTSGKQMTGYARRGEKILRQLWKLRDEYVRISPLTTGVLQNALTESTGEISIKVLETSPLSGGPFTVPDAVAGLDHTPPIQQAGSIWIEGERIEYFGYVHSGINATFSQLRRATRGTSLSNHPSGVMVYNGDVLFNPD